MGRWAGGQVGRWVGRYEFICWYAGYVCLPDSCMHACVRTCLCLQRPCALTIGTPSPIIHDTPRFQSRMRGSALSVKIPGMRSRSPCEDRPESSRRHCRRSPGPCDKKPSVADLASLPTLNSKLYLEVFVMLVPSQAHTRTHEDKLYLSTYLSIHLSIYLSVYLLALGGLRPGAKDVGLGELGLRPGASGGQVQKMQQIVANLLARCRTYCKQQHNLLARCKTC